MIDTDSIPDLRQALAAGSASPESVAEQALARANSNASHNVYISLDAGRTLSEASALPSRFASNPKPLLYGLPVSLKDCFDLAGFPTSCGSKFYAAKNRIARADSSVAARLRSQGAVIVGKAHLHQLAYGITGENPDYGDCVQPRDPSRLTTLSDVTLSTTPYQLVLDLATEHLTVYENGQQIMDFPAGIGSPDDPTVTGSYFVTMRVPPPDRGYGPFVLVDIGPLRTPSRTGRVRATPSSPSTVRSPPTTIS